MSELRDLLRSRLLPGLLFAALPAALAGCGGGLDDSDPVAVTARVVPETVAPGKQATILWRFRLADGWHLYWTGRNDSGFPPQIELELPDGWLAGGLQWPAPHRHLAPGGILDHVYTEELVLLQRVSVPETAAEGPVNVPASLRWLGCKEACVPGQATMAVEFDVRVGGGGVRDDDLAAAKASLPLPLPAEGFSLAWEGSVFTVSSAAGGRLVFMPTEDCGELVDLVTDGAGDRLALRFETRAGTAGPVRGLLVREDPAGDRQAYILNHPATELNTTTSDPGG